ncbi:MAG: hypothetical protein KME29_21355 [Calothrix sp. FI2-JRJ7]|jgi:hypothetical protein|nr:hypothetical protein [Calothrix sp. FI2-JRJ7]
MTVANQSATASSVISIDKRSTQARHQWKLHIVSLVQKTRWRLYAYSVVFKVMLLTLGSLAYLYVYWMSRNVLSVVSKHDASER